MGLPNPKLLLNDSSFGSDLRAAYGKLAGKYDSLHVNGNRPIGHSGLNIFSTPYGYFTHLLANKKRLFG